MFKAALIAFIVLLCLSTAFAGDELKVYIQDHTATILDTQQLPTSVPVEQFSDFAAIVLGQTPLYTDSPVPITNSNRRAKASLTIVTQDALPTITPQITLTETNKAQSPSGAVIQSITGANSCILGSQSLNNQIFATSPDSLVLSFSSQEGFANAMCGHFPTTTPTSTSTPAKTVCATLDAFVGATSTEYSDATSNSAIAQVVALNQNTKFDTLQAQFAITVTETEVTIDGQVYPRQEVDQIIRELAYMTNVAANLSTFGTMNTDAAVDMITFVVSSANAVTDNTKLVALIERVAQYVVTQYAAAYENSLLSSIVIAPVALNAAKPCVSNGSGLGVTQGTDVSVESVRSYQIVLWLVLGLLTVAVFGFSSTASMHILPDPALQGGMSTYWTHKK